jgi:hypothetical protein
MQNALFKTKEPTAMQEKVEFYNISLSLQDIDGQRLSVVQEKHGWWDNETQKASWDEEFVSPPEAFVFFGEAVDRFCTLRIRHARNGFMHSFSWHPVTGAPAGYTRVELPIEPRFEAPERCRLSA